MHASLYTEGEGERGREGEGVRERQGRDGGRERENRAKLVSV